MAEGDSFIYNSFKEWVFKGVYNLAQNGHELKISLHEDYVPDLVNHRVRADVLTSEYKAVTGGSNYTDGGKKLTNQVVGIDAANGRAYFDADDVTWQNLNLIAIGDDTPSHAILWDDTPPGPPTDPPTDPPPDLPTDPLIAVWVLGATRTTGGNYTLAWSTNGILTLT